METLPAGHRTTPTFTPPHFAFLQFSMHIKRPTAFFFLCLLLFAGCSSEEKPAEQTATETVERTLMLSGQPLLLEGFNGTIQVEGRPDSTASVRIEKKASGLSQSAADSLLDAIAIEESRTRQGHRLRVFSDQPSASADIYLSMPYKTALTIETGNSNVEVEAMAAPVDINLEQGAVRIKGAADDLDVRTGNGNIDVDMVGFPDSTDVRLRTVNGQIMLSLPARVPGTLRADAKIGTVALSGFELEDPKETRTTTGIFQEGRIGEGKGRIRLSTENGSIEVAKQ